MPRAVTRGFVLRLRLGAKANKRIANLWLQKRPGAGSDDDSFLAIGNNVVAQVGGVHGDSATTYSTSLGAGTYLLTLFHVDRQQTGASLQFSIETSNVTLHTNPRSASALRNETGRIGSAQLAQNAEGDAHRCLII